MTQPAKEEDLDDELLLDPAREIPALLELLIRVTKELATATGHTKAMTTCTHDSVDALTVKVDEMMRYLGLPRQRRGRVIGSVSGIPSIEYEDGGQAMIVEVSEQGTDWYVRIQSYDGSDSPVHPIADQIAGKKIRVTVEVVE